MSKWILLLFCALPVLTVRLLTGYFRSEDFKHKIKVTYPNGVFTVHFRTELQSISSEYVGGELKTFSFSGLYASKQDTKLTFTVISETKLSLSAGRRGDATWLHQPFEPTMSTTSAVSSRVKKPARFGDHFSMLSAFSNAVCDAAIIDLLNSDWLASWIGKIGLDSKGDRPSPVNASHANFGKGKVYQLDEANIGLCRIPRQFAEYLIALVGHGPVTSYLDVGTRRGTTITVVAIYLKRFGLLFADTINVENQLSFGLKKLWSELKLPINDYVFERDASPLSILRSHYDAIFVEGQCDYESARHDFIVYRKITRRIAFHNINDYSCVGFRKLWQELRLQNDTFKFTKMTEFTYHSHGVSMVGIGLVFTDWNTLSEDLVFKRYAAVRERIKGEVASRSSGENQLRSPHRPFSVYYAVFAGRKEFMKIQFNYLDILLSQKVIDEVHLWDFTKKKSDKEYMKDYIDNNGIPGYLLFEGPVSASAAWGSKPDFQKYHWGTFYEHYATSERYSPNDVFIKADDDIVFIDVLKFRMYVEATTSHNFHFPYIVNNDVGFYIQAMRTQHPELLRMKESFEKLGINFSATFDTYYDSPNNTRIAEMCTVCPITAPYCSLGNASGCIDRGWAEGWFSRGDFADKVHSLFLKDPTVFQNSHFSKETRFVHFKRRISINMFAARFGLVREAFSLFLHDQCCDDEGFMGKWPSLSHLDHIIDTRYVTK